MSKPKKNAEGVKKLAIWMAAESKAVAVLGILVANNTITEDAKNLNLKDCTNALLNEDKWESIFAGARAYSSNDSQIKSSEKKKTQLFKWLDLNLKNLWDEINDDQRKNLKQEFFILNRYISNVSSNKRDLQEHFVLTVNEYFNKKIDERKSIIKNNS